MSVKVKTIKSDAIVKIEIGAGFLQKLQRVFLSFSTNLTPEQVEKYKIESNSGEEFTEEWMQSVTTLAILLKEIETKAEEQGFIVEETSISEQDN
jgi:hypothetical protein